MRTVRLPPGQQQGQLTPLLHGCPLCSPDTRWCATGCAECDPPPHVTRDDAIRFPRAQVLQHTVGASATSAMRPP
eukprot:401768-Heterocapsa_arctica.AAC.1